jgi:hypothetical protein
MSFCCSKKCTCERWHFSIDILKEYQSNEIAADSKYKGKLIEIYGTVESVGKDIFGDPYVALKGVGFFCVQCFFGNEFLPELAKVKKGDFIFVKGFCEGKMGNVLIKKCTDIYVAG